MSLQQTTSQMFGGAKQHHLHPEPTCGGEEGALLRKVLLYIAHQAETEGLLQAHVDAPGPRSRAALSLQPVPSPQTTSQMFVEIVEVNDLR